MEKQDTTVLSKRSNTPCNTHKKALSFGIGLYIAFSPFPGAHTAMMFVAHYLFKLHWPTLFVSASLCNPWTLISIFYLDYAFGYWLLHDCFKINLTWTISFAKIFGRGSICIVSFLAGGNILAVMFGLLGYIGFRKCAKYAKQWPLKI